VTHCVVWLLTIAANVLTDLHFTYWLLYGYGCDVQTVFRALDSNNDGYFNSYELRNALHAVGMFTTESASAADNSDDDYHEDAEVFLLVTVHHGKCWKQNVSSYTTVA